MSTYRMNIARSLYAGSDMKSSSVLTRAWSPWWPLSLQSLCQALGLVVFRRRHLRASTCLMGREESAPSARQEARYLHSTLCTADCLHLSEQTGHQHRAHRDGQGRRHTRHVPSCCPGEKTVGDSVRISSPALMSRIATRCLEHFPSELRSLVESLSLSYLPFSSTILKRTWCIPSITNNRHLSSLLCCELQIFCL